MLKFRYFDGYLKKKFSFHISCVFCSQNRHTKGRLLEHYHYFVHILLQSGMQKEETLEVVYLYFSTKLER